MQPQTARLSRGAFHANDGDIKLKVPGARGGSMRASVRRQGSPAAGSTRAGQRVEVEDTMGLKASRPPDIIRG